MMVDGFFLGKDSCVVVALAIDTGNTVECAGFASRRSKNQ